MRLGEFLSNSLSQISQISREWLALLETVHKGHRLPMDSHV